MTSAEIWKEVLKSSQEIQALMNSDLSQVAPRELEGASEQWAKRLSAAVSRHESLRDLHRRVRGTEAPEWNAMMERQESPAYNRAVVSPEPFYGAVAFDIGSGVAYLRAGWTLVRCHGEAHRSEHEKSHECPLCQNAPWGWRAVKG